MIQSNIRETARVVFPTPVTAFKIFMGDERLKKSFNSISSVLTGLYNSSNFLTEDCDDISFFMRLSTVNINNLLEDLRSSYEEINPFKIAFVCDFSFSVLGPEFLKFKQFWYKSFSIKTDEIP